MDRQIVDPAITYNAAILSGDLYFKMEKIHVLYTAAIQIIARLQIVMLDDNKSSSTLKSSQVLIKMDYR